MRCLSWYEEEQWYGNDSGKFKRTYGETEYRNAFIDISDQWSFCVQEHLFNMKEDG